MGFRLACQEHPGPPQEVAAAATIGDTVSPAPPGARPMNSLAANHTVVRPPLFDRGLDSRCSFVEDLNWPAVPPAPDKKTPRPTEVWVPGPNGQWEGVTPTLQ
jgi:hypothetical protein